MTTPVLDLETFARQWAVEGRRIAWLLGAGASASANIPTASQIVVDLQASMFAAAHGIVLQDLDLADRSTRDAVVAYYDGMNGMPPAGDPGDYSAAFELALPNEGPRRQYLRGQFVGRSPSYGQRILGALLTQGLADVVLTTNFDDLIEQAAEQARAVLTSPPRPRLGVAALGDTDRAGLALSDNDFPLLVKLHGDFRERQLKNLADELQRQDAQLRQAFLDSSRRFGLAVIGYSGRDASVMEMLTHAVQTVGALPAGLWWMTSNPDAVLPAVADLMSRAEAAGVAAHYVRIENFDETFAALGRQATLDSTLRTHVDRLRPEPRVIDAAVPELDAGPLPVLRMNALPVIDAPKRALQASLPTHLTPRELTQSLRGVGWRGALTMSGQRVLALGNPKLMTTALKLSTPPAEVTIDCLRQDASTLERALAYEAVTRALARRLPTHAIVRQRGHQLRIRPYNDDRPDSELQAAARKLIQDAYSEPLHGTCPQSLGRGPDGHHREFAESVRLSIEWRFGILWLLFVPHTWVSPPAEGTTAAGGFRGAVGRNGVGDPAASWRKERWVNRRNERWAAIIKAWAHSLAPDPQTKVSVLPGGVSDPDSVDGEFVLSRTTAYSRMAR